MSPIDERVFRSLPDGNTRLLGIVGDPLDHSRSPELHTAVLREMGRNLVYLPVPVSATRLRAFLGLAAEIGFVGLNVTTPYKEKVFGLVEPMEEETRRTRMVNTVSFEGGKPRGTGTDGAGVLRWLRWVDAPGPYGVLGFGPTARSIVHRAWAENAPIEIVVTRRSRAVRAQLSKWRGEDGLPGNGPSVIGWDEIDAARPGVIGTWISVLPPGVPTPQPFWDAIDRNAVLLDMNYGEGRTDQCSAARRHGHRAADGLGPLLEQAALSLSMWLHENVPVSLFHRVCGARQDELRPR